MKKVKLLLTVLLLCLCGSVQPISAAVDWGLSTSSLTSITANQMVVIKEGPRTLSDWSQNSYLNSGSSEVVATIDYSCIYKFVENGTVTYNENPYQVYVLYNVATGKYLSGENNYTANKDDAFQFVASTAETATANDIDNSTDWEYYHNKTSLNLTGQTETMWVFCKKDEKSYLNFVGNPGIMNYRDTNIWLIYSVNKTQSEIEANALTMEKERAFEKINEFSQLSTLSPISASTVINQINAIELSLYSFDDAITEVNNLKNTFIDNCYQAFDNKAIIFTNKATNERQGWHITSTGAKAKGTNSDWKNYTTWTIKYAGNGTFKLYNAYTGKYLGTASSGGALSTDAANGSAFIFVIRGTNQVSLKDQNGNILHQANSGSYMAYNSADPASNWDIQAVELVADENIAALAANNATMMTAAYSYFQEKYGLVKDAEKISVVVIETEHTSDAHPVSNLLDGKTSTFVHSSYGSDKGTAPHYIQVELSEATQNIMFYMAKRNDNDNNRPSTIKVYVSNDGETFGETPVATLENLWVLGDPYVSPTIDLGAAYKYVRFVVSQTNTSTLFFTASEFYVLPVNAETAYLNPTTWDVTNVTTTYLDEQYAMANTSATYAPKNAARAILAASTYADTPALGQYTTTAYNTLQAACDNTSISLADFNAAMDEFERGQNRPVFIFTSANDGQYSGNCAIYDNAGSSWKWKTQNYYDKSMLFTLKDATETTMNAGTAYNVYSYENNRKLYYDGTVTPEAVSGKEGVYNLKVNTGYHYLHCQAAGAALVTWYACALNNEGTSYNNMASAWRIEYMCNSFDLDQKTDFPVAANQLMGYSLNCTADNFGSGLGQFSGVDYPTLEAAMNKVKELQAQENTTRYSTTNTEVNAAITNLDNALAGATMNQPAPNKFYRLRNLASNKYMTSTLTDSKMTMDAANNTRESVFYLTADNKLVSYENGLFTKNFTSSNYGFEAVGSEGTAVSFAQGNPVTAATSCYHLTCGTRSLYGKNATIDAGNNVAVNNADNGYDWAIEEVQWLPVAVSSTVKYGTLYAPVNLRLRDKLEAFTGSIDAELLRLNPVENVIPAGTGVVLKDKGADRDKTTECIYLEVVADATPISTNDLAGSYTTIAALDYAYTLQNQSGGLGFYPFNGSSLAGFKAYMINGLGVRGFAFQEGETTAIEAAEAIELNQPIYDLSGRRVQKAVKGFYIIGGKKVYVK